MLFVDVPAIQAEWLTGLSRDTFDSEWRKCSQVEKCSVTWLDEYIRAHYLSKRPAIIVLGLKMTVRKEPVGMAIYAMPPPESETRYGGKTWECDTITEVVPNDPANVGQMISMIDNVPIE